MPLLGFIVGSEHDILVGAKGSARLLVVEDDPVSAILLQKIFERQGLRVDLATTGNEALILHKENRYRLVLSDWIMPGMSGVDLCREMRKIEGPYLYFILCSSRGQREDRLEAFEAGVDDFLAKPVDPDELQSRLKVARRFLGIEDNLQRQNAELEKANEKFNMMNVSLSLASKRFEELFNGLPVACFTFDQQGLIHEWNRAAHQKFGILPHEALQRPVWEVLGLGDNTFWTPDLVTSVFNDDVERTIDWSYHSTSGDLRYFACNVFCLRNNVGGVLGAISANLDITERELAEQQIYRQMVQINEFAEQLEIQKKALIEANERLQHLAVTDGLTGLWNHRMFHEELERRVATYHLSGRPLSLVLLDIDHFKSFNDNFGHQAGDDLLRRFAHILRSQCRGTDIPARYGGEEFAVILDGASIDDAKDTAERLRRAIEREPWVERAVTASFGVTTISSDTMSTHDLVSQADQALYGAKHAGRNCVVHFGEMSPAQKEDAA